MRYKRAGYEISCYCEGEASSTRMLKACLILALAAVAAAKDTYVVLAPKSLRPGVALNVSVSLLQKGAAADVTAELYNSATKATIATDMKTFTQGTPGSLELKVPDELSSGSYVLRVAGSGQGINFTNETSIAYESKSISIFIQTDKAMYKPGQTVNFRAFAVFPNLTVYTGSYDIDIYDPSTNKIKQWIGVKDVTGVVTNYMRMDTQPVLGDWKIKVSAHGRSTEKAFTVAHYVLPKFEVSVELASFMLTADNTLDGKVKATYTYGKPVTGKVSIRASVGTSYSRDTKSMVTQTFDIDGEASFSIPMATFQDAHSNLNGYMMLVEANVTESLNKITLGGNSTVDIYADAVKLEFLESNPDTFKPGLNYIAYLKVTQQDDTPLPGTKKDLQVEIRATYQDEMPTTTPYYYYQPDQHSYNLPETMLAIPDGSIVPIQVPVPSNSTSINLQVHYGSVSQSLSLSKSYSPSSTYMQLSLDSTRVTAGDVAMFSIDATESIGDAVYQVMSRGSVVATGSLTGDSFSVPVTSAMAPNARIIVYYVRTDGEVVTDSISFDVEGAFQNQVALSFDKTQAKPGETVNVVVSADPQSVVNLLAVDQSVLLLKSGNDVTQSQVIDELKSYDPIDDTSISPIRPMVDFAVARKKRMIWFPYPRYYGGSDASAIFDNSGVKVMTDAMVYQHVERQVYVGGGFLGGGGGHWAGIESLLGGAGGGAAMTSSSAAGASSQAAVSKIRNLEYDGFGGVDDLEGGIRAPMAMVNSAPAPIPDASSTSSVAKVGRVRKAFPETWLWSNSTVGDNGTVTISTTIPDTITSWIASAFATNVHSGLGIASSSAKVKAFKPFFVSLNLPYSLVRGEEFALQANVFNYMDQDTDVLVILKNSSDFRNIVNDGNGNTQYVTKDVTQTVTVAAGAAKSVFFPIIPAALGKIALTVTAQSSMAADAVQRRLLVEAEGVHKEYSNPILIDLKNSTSFSQDVSLSMPDTVVADSQRLVISAIGDLMGPTVNGLDKLLRMPTGCGEQTMIGFAPDIFVTNYLTATNQLTGEIEEKAIGYMEKGYQRELTFQHSDGSFSAFGDNDDSGSMWLTAFVTKSFHQAKRQIFIDDDTIKVALDWMIQHQTSNGSFPEPGRVIHKDMQGGSASGIGLTAFVLISLLENNDLGGDIQTRIDNAASKAITYLEDQLPHITDDYVLSLTSYVLTLAQSSQADMAYKKLYADAIMTDGVIHWHKAQPATTSSHWRPSHSQANPIDIEMTAYALLVQAAKTDFGAGIPIMKWITSQRNANGGFSSTQDTVIALQALSDFARMAYSDSFDIQATVTADNFTHTFSINKQNALVLQSVVLQTVPSIVTITATGHGMALINIDLSFNVEQEIEEVSFNVDVTLVTETKEMLSIETCTTWLKDGSSGMAVQEIGIPSGFEADLESLEKYDHIKKVETEDRKVVLYFNEISPKAMCVTLDVFRTSMVAKTKPAAVRVYDYYQPSNQVTTFYQSHVLEKTEICDVCADCDCVALKG